MGCERSECSIITTAGGILAFGSGELDKNGYWTEPCNFCARDWEKENQLYKCWPFDNQKERMKALYFNLHQAADDFQDAGRNELDVAVLYRAAEIIGGMK